jgi:hypothetical protein
MSVKIMTCPSPDIRIFLAQIRLNEVEVEMSASGGEGGVCEALSEIPGIERVFIESSVVTICKWPNARWEEIEPSVVELLECFR